MLGFFKSKLRRQPITSVENTSPRLPSCEERLAHAKKLGFEPAVIFDCGAFIGRWAKKTANLFPKAHFVLFEPNTEIKSEIDENTSLIKNRVTLVQAAVGEKEGKASLNVWTNSQHNNKTTQLAGSSILDHVQGDAAKKLEVPVRSLDNVAEELGMYPDLLKLDLQGFELPALKGASKVLEKAEMCIIEFGCLDAYCNRTTPYDLMKIMNDFNYVLYDIVDIRYRPYDGALTGGDFFFVKKESSLKAHKDYF